MRKRVLSDQNIHSDWVSKEGASNIIIHKASIIRLQNQFLEIEAIYIFLDEVEFDKDKKIVLRFRKKRWIEKVFFWVREKNIIWLLVWNLLLN